MTQRRINIFIPIGLLAFVAGILLRRFTHASYTDFAAGVLMGIAAVLMIYGIVQQLRGA